MFENLTEDNFQLFAMKHYLNPHCTDLLEFHDDLRKIRYIKRLFKKYEETGELKERLILNHLVILYNMFDSRAMTRMLFLKLDEYKTYLKPFLMFLNYWPTDIGRIEGNKIVDSNISLDQGIIEALRKI
jgi:hypothetical protein